MNSYPLEPLMFVAGLLPAQPAAAGSPARARSGSASRPRSESVSRPRADSLAAPSLLSAAASPTLPEGATMTTPLGSPAPDADAGVSGVPLASPPVVPSPSRPDGVDGAGAASPDAAAAAAPSDPKDVFLEQLVSDLRGALTPMGGKSKVWLSDAERRNFRILLVDKLALAAPTPNDPAPAPHSPLSPLTPSSPLHPDGLIAPVWVRKHAELVPAVFVLFLRLYEPALVDAEGGELESDEAQARDAAERQREAEADEGLVREIADRRRRLGERGIKLTVVLMASSTMLDSPTLDTRLSHLRRASALSAKASLFVLTPVPADQLPDFVQSLQDALYDGAMEYYALHAKRVRRKRARVPASQLGFAGPPPPPAAAAAAAAAPSPARALAPAGWAVRYDWKAGWYAEVRGEHEAARRHYEDCWNELARMFASTSLLPPRTKRWAEAKVLADCVATRICKLLLYDSAGARVLTPFHVHLKRFGDLSRGWGIGEETFEFWSWTARQYRIFAELLETAVGAGLPLPPSPLPDFPATAPPPPAPIGPDYWTTPTSAVQPSQVLHSPAYYFYAAACCSIERKVRFEEAVKAEGTNSEIGTAGGYIATAPGFANEKKVDHAALVIELFTKAYSLLKDQHYAQTRVALYVAFRIAETYCQSGQYELAMRFFDRISQTFKRDKWAPIVREIRSMWYDCAQRTGSVETAARLLVEMMAPQSGVESDDRAALADDLLSLLRTTAPSSSEPIIVEADGLLSVRAGFWSATAPAPSAVPFQVAVSTPEGVDVSALSFAELHVSFTDDRPDLVVVSPQKDAASDLVDVGTVDGTAAEVSADLRWVAGRELVLSGLVPKDVEGEVAVGGVRLVLRESAWAIEVRLPVEPLAAWATPRGPFVPTTPLAAATAFATRPHDVDLNVTHLPTALAGERFPITVTVRSKDDRALDVKLSVCLQPGDDDDDGSTITIGETTSPSLVKDIDLGVLAPAATTETAVVLVSPAPGVKVLDVSLRTTVVDEASAEPPGDTSGTPGAPDAPGIPGGRVTEEHAESTVVAVESPFALDASVRYPHAYGRAVVSAALAVTGRAVVVDRLVVEAEDAGVEVVSTSIGPDFPQTWDASGPYACVANLRLSARRSSLAPMSAASVVVTWRPAPPTASAAPAPPAAPTTTRLALPPLALPPRDAFLLAALHAPAAVRVDEPFKLALRLRNTHPAAPARAAVVAETAERYVFAGPRRIARVVVPAAGAAAVGAADAGREAAADAAGTGTDKSTEAGTDTVLELTVTAVGAPGWAPPPVVRVFEGEGADARELAVELAPARILVRP